MHGGPDLVEPVVIDADIERRLRELVDLAPLHQPKSLHGLEAARRLLPDVPHVACFDTAFHATLPPEAYTYVHRLAGSVAAMTGSLGGLDVLAVHRRRGGAGGRRDDFTTIGITTRAVVPCRSRIPDAQAQRMPAETAPASIDAHRDVLWNAAAGLDPVRARLEIEAAIGAALRRNTRLRGHHITVTAGAEGLVTLTGTVPTQALRQEVELSCWTVPGVWTLHDDLAVGRSAIRA